MFEELSEEIEARTRLDKELEAKELEARNSRKASPAKPAKTAKAIKDEYVRLFLKKLEEEKELKEYMEAGKDNYFDPSEIQAELGAKVIWDIFCKLRAGDVANKLHVPVYKKPEAEVEAEQGDAKGEKKEGGVWQDPETGLFWATKPE
ncbi:hypothetical protein N0V87_009652 [Didymella glomerata]|uniref:Uncharacterized protein n=1 Tax=Didymella glomerata TaxID=749621 RepID=A0A9W8WQR0_9PLEO|nr:hypothetical protein N0V87_009652 [Didymella glomerata]